MFVTVREYDLKMSSEQYHLSVFHLCAPMPMPKGSPTWLRAKATARFRASASVITILLRHDFFQWSISRKGFGNTGLSHCTSTKSLLSHRFPSGFFDPSRFCTVRGLENSYSTTPSLTSSLPLLLSLL